jgi:hypothetical protein
MRDVTSGHSTVDKQHFLDRVSKPRSSGAKAKIHGAGHAGGLRAQPREYERRVSEFFDRALLQAAAR